MKIKRYRLETVAGSEWCSSKKIKKDEDFLLVDFTAD